MTAHWTAGSTLKEDDDGMDLIWMSGVYGKGLMMVWFWLRTRWSVDEQDGTMGMPMAPVVVN